MKIQWRSWYGDREVELPLPTGWTVHEARMADAPALGLEEMARAIRAPIGVPPLRELARQSKSACVVVEDITRPLQAALLLPTLVSELHAGGLALDKVRIVMGLGAHTPMDRTAIVRKLGRSIVSRYESRQHQPYENLEFLGKSSLGTPVYINKLFLEADLRIAVGGIVPHGMAGFGGGAKTVAVGVAGIETLDVSHHRSFKAGRMPGVSEGCEFRADLEEIARMAGLRFIVGGVINSRREIAGVFAGEPHAAHRAGLRLCKTVSATPAPPSLADIVIVNAYPKDTDLWQLANSMNPIGSSISRVLKPEGTFVFATACSFGAGAHGFDGLYMRGHSRMKRERMARGEHGPIIFSPNLTPFDPRGTYPDDTLVLNRWAQVVDELRRRHGEQASVSVFPCAAIQMPA